MFVGGFYIYTFNVLVHLFMLSLATPKAIQKQVIKLKRTIFLDPLNWKDDGVERKSGENKFDLRDPYCDVRNKLSSDHVDCKHVFAALFASLTYVLVRFTFFLFFKENLFSNSSFMQNMIQNKRIR